MNEKKKPVRKKGRAETIIEDLSRYGLTIAGVAMKNGVETIIRIDTQNPYKNGGVFGECDLYRIFSADGLPVIDKKHLSGVRRWIDNGDIKNWEEIARKQQAATELRKIIGD